MLNQYKRKRDDGFTIIEVMIVLAIAGLIMLIVFLAVPALQRTSRNTQRKNDVSALLSAYTDYVNNNGGQIPSSCDGTSGSTCFISNAKLGYYAGNTANVSFTKKTGASAISDPNSPDKVVIANYSKCASATQSTSTNATMRSVVAVYDVETSSGLTEQCQES